MKTAFVFLSAFLLFAGSSLAASQPLEKYSKYGTVINDLDLSASRSFEVNLSPGQLGGVWGLMTAYICVTDADDSVTALNMSCTTSHDGGSTDYTLQDCAVSSGACTSSDASWTKNPSAITSPKCWPWRVDIESLPHIECTITDTGGDASDTLNVVATFATKG